MLLCKRLEWLQAAVLLRPNGVHRRSSDCSHEYERHINVKTSPTLRSLHCIGVFDTIVKPSMSENSAFKDADPIVRKSQCGHNVLFQPESVQATAAFL